MLAFDLPLVESTASLACGGDDQDGTLAGRGASAFRRHEENHLGKIKGGLYPRMMSQLTPANQVAIAGRPRPRILRGALFTLLALGQLIFSFVFAYRFYIVSQGEWATLDSRWIFPIVALVSLWVFALEAWRSFAPGKGQVDDGGTSGRARAS